MAICKFCGVPFAWGQSEDKWVPLIPLGEEEDLPRDYQDENGNLRSGHRQICVTMGGPAVRVVKLAKTIPAECDPMMVEPETGEIKERKKHGNQTRKARRHRHTDT